MLFLICPPSRRFHDLLLTRSASDRPIRSNGYVCKRINSIEWNDHCKASLRVDIPPFRAGRRESMRRMANVVVALGAILGARVATADQGGAATEGAEATQT